METKHNKTTDGSSPPENNPEIDVTKKRDYQDLIETTVNRFLFTPRERPTQRAHLILSEWMHRMNRV